MPAWVKDHEVWEEAKQAAKQQYPSLGETDRFWVMVTSIYKKMHGRIGKAVLLFVGRFRKGQLSLFGDEEVTVPRKTPITGHLSTEPQGQPLMCNPIKSRAVSYTSA